MPSKMGAFIHVLFYSILFSIRYSSSSFSSSIAISLHRRRCCNFYYARCCCHCCNCCLLYESRLNVKNGWQTNFHVANFPIYLYYVGPDPDVVFSFRFFSVLEYGSGGVALVYHLVHVVEIEMSPTFPIPQIFDFCSTFRQNFVSTVQSIVQRFILNSCIWNFEAKAAVSNRKELVCLSFRHHLNCECAMCMGP